MLNVNEVVTHYGNIQALKGISLEVNRGEIVALIGSNGAGKTTTLKTISGLLSVSFGAILLEQESIHSLSPFEIVRRGIAHCPEGRRVWPDMTVFENLQMGAYLINKRSKVEQNLKEMYKLFPVLRERRNQMAGSLSGGEQQMLAIARAFMSNPKILLLDEPSLGLAPIVVERLAETIIALNQNGVTILLVEQNAKLALTISSRAYVMSVGTISLSGQSNDLLRNDLVQKTYLGLRDR